MSEIAKGKRFEHAFSASLNRLPGLSLRLLDGGSVAKHDMPGDFIYFATTGTSYLIECKETAEKSFPFSKLKDHQLQSLISFGKVASGMKGFVALSFYDKDLPNDSTCILIPAPVYAAYKAGANRKSIPRPDAQRIGFECPKIGAVWNVAQVFERR